MSSTPIDEECTQLGESLPTTEDGSQPFEGGSQAQEPWGRLLPLKRGEAHIKLFLRPAPDEPNSLPNCYVIGRGRACDIRLDDARISSQHCRIFCIEGQEAGRITLKAYIEDTSSNGTYINRSVRLQKGQRRLLNSGDECSLIKSKDIQDHEASSYIFIPMEPSGAKVLRPSNLLSPSPSICLRSSPSRRFGLFGGGRRIEEFYDIRDEIGRGTCGRVHIALHRKTGEAWAVKMIETRKFGLTPGLSPKELIQEAEVLRTISHPNVVRLQDIFQSQNALYLVMELVRGGDLFDRIIDRGRYPEAAARELMRHILQAVQYLHARNIVHRDLKPENILLATKESDVDVKLTDFGLAKRTTSEGLKTFCGTPQYFAPEVLKRRNTTLGTGRYGREADMWSVGVILYIVLSGMPPFDDSTLFEQIRMAKYTFGGNEWEGVSDEAKDLVCKLMTASPTTRLSVDDALRHPWFTGPAAVKQSLQLESAADGFSTTSAQQQQGQRQGGMAASARGDDTASKSGSVSTTDGEDGPSTEIDEKSTVRHDGHAADVSSNINSSTSAATKSQQQQYSVFGGGRNGGGGPSPLKRGGGGAAAPSPRGGQQQQRKRHGGMFAPLITQTKKQKNAAVSPVAASSGGGGGGLVLQVSSRISANGRKGGGGGAGVSPQPSAGASSGKKGGASVSGETPLSVGSSGNSKNGGGAGGKRRKLSPSALEVGPTVELPDDQIAEYSSQEEEEEAEGESQPYSSQPSTRGGAQGSNAVRAGGGASASSSSSSSTSPSTILGVNGGGIGGANDAITAAAAGGPSHAMFPPRPKIVQSQKKKKKQQQQQQQPRPSSAPSMKEESTDAAITTTTTTKATGKGKEAESQRNTQATLTGDGQSTLVTFTDAGQSTVPSKDSPSSLSRKMMASSVEAGKEVPSMMDVDEGERGQGKSQQSSSFQPQLAPSSSSSAGEEAAAGVVVDRKGKGEIDGQATQGPVVASSATQGGGSKAGKCASSTTGKKGSTTAATTTQGGGASLKRKASVVSSKKGGGRGAAAGGGGGIRGPQHGKMGGGGQPKQTTLTQFLLFREGGRKK